MFRRTFDYSQIQTVRKFYEIEVYLTKKKQTTLQLVNRRYSVVNYLINFFKSIDNCNPTVVTAYTPVV